MKEIAATLNLSTRTVETHKYEMMQVLVYSTAELVRTPSIMAWPTRILPYLVRIFRVASP